MDDAAAHDPVVVGAKAAALATARQAGLPALDGFVLTTTAVDTWRRTALAERPELQDELWTAWQRLNDRGPVIVRSSSPNEDGAASSLAGHFTSVPDVQDWDGLLHAIDAVIASASALHKRATNGDAPDSTSPNGDAARTSSNGGPARTPSLDSTSLGDTTPDSPSPDSMAVLIQPYLHAAWGGVLFGADPVTGRRDRRVVAAVPSGPDRLVSGTETGSQTLLSRRGRVLESAGDTTEVLARRAQRRALIKLADRAGSLFESPQDIEWALTQGGDLVLLQSRPITAIGAAAAPTASGPVFGPGPVAETFPAALSHLEVDLWVPPLREGLQVALSILGSASARQLRTSPAVVTVAGRPAVDLDLLGASPVRPSRLTRLNPLPPARQVLAAWRVGRLRAALPGLAGDLIRDVDAELRAVPPLEHLPSADLLRILERSQGLLRSLHGYEVLAGQLHRPDEAEATAAGHALAVLSTERAAHPQASDEQLLAEHPVLLALSAPSIRASGPHLPPAPGPASRSNRGNSGDQTPWRETLRLRIRWLHELTARSALALGRNLTHRGVLSQAEAITHLTFDQLQAAVTHPPQGPDEQAHQPSVSGLSRSGDSPEGAPLPAAFRLLANDVVVPVAASGPGQGAGGGRAIGQVHQGDSPPPPGAVLVTATLDPELAALLPSLSGLVTETGSLLSHLAILAREHNVPTVVGLADARQQYPADTWVVVDGTSGDVDAIESQEWRSA